VHVGDAFAGAGHSAAAQHFPVAMQAPLQSLKPPLHWKPQLAPSQVGVALAGAAGQGEQLVPHEPTSLALEHCAPHV
jgi:hypothetical protein